MLVTVTTVLTIHRLSVLRTIPCYALTCSCRAVPDARARRQWFGRHRLPDEGVHRVQVQGQARGRQPLQLRSAKQHQAKDQREIGVAHPVVPMQQQMDRL